MPDKQELVFLSYAREDETTAMQLCQELVASGVRVWFDRTEIAPGANWKLEIRKAIRQSRYFIALMSSKSVSKKGFVQNELRQALEVLKEYPENEIYLIPVRLDRCEAPFDELNDFQWVDLFPETKDGTDKLLRLFGITTKESSAGSFTNIAKREGLFAPTVRLDGIYQSKRIDDFDSVIRFYADGLVIRTSTTGAPDKIAKWFNKDWAETKGQKGKYVISGSNIQFSTRSSAGIIDLDGTIEEDSLILKSHSHINGHRSVQEYRFVYVEELS